MDQKKYLWYVLGAVVVVIVLSSVLRNGQVQAPGNSPSPTSTPSASVSPTSGVRATPRPAPSGSGVLSYGDALKKYEGRRIQFDARCQATPSRITVKNGESIMLDNRSGDARTFTVGSVQYQLAGYGFRVLAMTSKVLPQTVFIDCGAALNVGQVVIQK